MRLFPLSLITIGCAAIGQSIQAVPVPPIPPADMHSLPKEPMYHQSQNVIVLFVPHEAIAAQMICSAPHKVITIKPYCTWKHSMCSMYRSRHKDRPIARARSDFPAKPLEAWRFFYLTKYPKGAIIFMLGYPLIPT